MKKAGNTIMVLIWKEYRELRWFTATGLIFLLLFPVFEGLTRVRRGGYFITGMPADMVLGFGGLLAIIFAVAAACRDLHPGLQMFWQSRPVTLRRWLTTKYMVGLAFVLITCCLPLLFQSVLEIRADYLDSLASGQPTNWLAELFYFRRFALGVLVCHTFTIVLIYSMAFLIGCLVRRAAHAAILSIAAGALIYFLPVLLPPLGWLSVYVVMQTVADYRGFHFYAVYVPFAAAMLASSAVTLLTTIVAVHRNWRLNLDLRLMCWALGGVAVLLFATFGFQLRSNLTCERAFSPISGSLPGFNIVVDAKTNGEQGVLILSRNYPGALPESTQYGICRFDLSTSDPVKQGPSVVVNGPLAHRNPVQAAWLPQNPERLYWLHTPDAQEGLSLLTVAFDVRDRDPIIHRLDLPTPDTVVQAESIVRMHAQGDKLYVLMWGYRPAYRREVIIINLQNPDAPSISTRVELKGPMGFSGMNILRGRTETVRLDLNLFPLPDLTNRERLEVSLGLEPPLSAILKGDLLIAFDDLDLLTFRLSDVGESVAHFSKIGERRATPLERLIRAHPRSEILENDFLYFADTGLGAGLTVYDLRDPAHPQRIGHYATPGEWFYATASLPNHRILAAGQKVRIIHEP